MDKLFIDQLRIPAIVGVFDTERTQTQDIIIDLHVSADLSDAAVEDNLTHTVDYAAVRESLIEFVTLSRYHLLEALADNIAGMLFSQYPINWLRLKINKPEVFSDVKGIGIIIERSR